MLIDLEGCHYGIDIRAVQDVRDHETPVPVAHAPAFVLGVLYAHGRAVPLVDLRSCLGLPATAAVGPKAVVILQVGGGLIAASVSSASAVVRLDSEPVGHAVGSPGAASGAFIAGVGRVGGRSLPLLDVEALARATRPDRAATDLS